MYKERINRTELAILKILMDDVNSITTMAKTLGLSKSYISECATHLNMMGFIEVQRFGNTTVLHIAQTPLGNELSRLLREEPIMNHYRLMGGSRLKVLPLVLEPGYTAGEICNRAWLSPRSVQGILGGWRQMGIAVLEAKTYTLNARHEAIISFVESYAEHRSLAHLKERFMDGTIVWQGRDEYIFSIGRSISDPEFRPAAYTRLAELGRDIISRNEYYHHSPLPADISEAEALIQAMKLDMHEPRVRRLLLQAMVRREDLASFSRKYGIAKEVEAIVDG